MNLLDRAKSLIEKAKAATPGPWSQFDNQISRCENLSAADTVCEFPWDDPKYYQPDADFITAANPEVVSQLAEAYLEAVAMANYYATMPYQSEAMSDDILQFTADEFLRKYGGEK